MHTAFIEIQEPQIKENPKPYDAKNLAYTLNPFHLILILTYMQAPQEPSVIESFAYQLIVHQSMNIPGIHPTISNTPEQPQSSKLAKPTPP